MEGKVKKEVEKTAGGLIVLDYNDLVNNEDLSASIQEAYGYDGFGLLVVKNVPNFEEVSKQLLLTGSKFAKLSEEVKNKYVKEETLYSFGWSHGKETLEPGLFGSSPLLCYFFFITLLLFI